MASKICVAGRQAATSNVQRRTFNRGRRKPRSNGEHGAGRMQNFTGSGCRGASAKRRWGQGEERPTSNIERPTGGGAGCWVVALCFLRLFCGRSPHSARRKMAAKRRMRHKNDRPIPNAVALRARAQSSRILGNVALTRWACCSTLFSCTRSSSLRN